MFANHSFQTKEKRSHRLDLDYLSIPQAKTKGKDTNNNKGERAEIIAQLFLAMSLVTSKKESHMGNQPFQYAQVSIACTLRHFL